MYLRIGSPFCYDASGDRRGTLSLQYAGAEGLFVRFWKRYDALLRHAFRKVTCKLQMPLADFLKFNIFTPKLLNGMPVLPINMKYSISRKGLEISEIEFRTLRLQLPYNLDVEQEVPLFNASAYYWVRKNDAETVAHSSPYEAYFWRHEILTAPEKPIRDYELPTEEQYNVNYHYPEGAFKLRVYHLYGIGPILPGGVQIPYIDLNYNSWLEPRKK